MRNDYIGQFGGNKPDKSYEDSKLVKAPLVIGNDGGIGPTLKFASD